MNFIYTYRAIIQVVQSNLATYNNCIILINLYTPLFKGSKFLAHLSGGGLEEGLGSMPENDDITTPVDVCNEADLVTEDGDTDNVDNEVVITEFVVVESALDVCTVVAGTMTVEVDIIVVVAAVGLVILTESYPVGGQSSGE